MYNLYPVIIPADPIESVSAVQVTAIDVLVEERSSLVGAVGAVGKAINPTLKVLLK